MTKIDILLITILTTACSFSANAEILKFGNETQATPSINGPQEIETQQGFCRYTLEIGENTHAHYNDPEIIIYKSTLPLKISQLPHLNQAESNSGYDWTFTNPGDRKSQWFGLMCDSSENFPFNPTTATDISPELEQVIDSNGRKCPAELHNGKFILKENLQSQKGYALKNISYNNWKGFIITHQPTHSENYDLLRFCLIHNDNVLVGATENYPNTPALDKEFPSKVESILKTLRFSEDN